MLLELPLEYASSSEPFLTNRKVIFIVRVLFRGFSEDQSHPILPLFTVSVLSTDISYPAEVHGCQQDLLLVMPLVCLSFFKDENTIFHLFKRDLHCSERT